jgi:hypothetical protein
MGIESNSAHDSCSIYRSFIVHKNQPDVFLKNEVKNPVFLVGKRGLAFSPLPLRERAGERGKGRRRNYVESDPNKTLSPLAGEGWGEGGKRKRRN